MVIRDAIIAQINEIATQQDRSLAPLTDELLLLESGLDSLCLALLVARLEDELGLDPFGFDGAVAIPATLGDFIQVYESAENERPTSAHASSSL